MKKKGWYKNKTTLKMDHPQFTSHPITALCCTVLSIASGIFASIVGNIEIYIRIGAGMIAIASGLMASRYYYYATKEKINQSKK